MTKLYEKIARELVDTYEIRGEKLWKPWRAQMHDGSRNPAYDYWPYDEVFELVTKTVYDLPPETLFRIAWNAPQPEPDLYSRYMVHQGIIIGRHQNTKDTLRSLAALGILETIRSLVPPQATVA